MSVLSGIGQLPTVFSDGQSRLLTSFNSGGNIPSTPLVSGTQYTFSNTPVPFGAGNYAIQLNFDLNGDNTTSFTRIRMQYGDTFGVVSNEDLLIGTTLPSTAVFDFATLFITNVSVPNNFVIYLTPTFTGTAPVTTGANITIFKV